VTIEILYSDGCPNHEQLAQRLPGLLRGAGIDADLTMRRVDNVEEAERERFLGSPTIRVNGKDIEPDADRRSDFGLKCRLYRTRHGLIGTPPDAWVLAALEPHAPPSPG